MAGRIRSKTLSVLWSCAAIVFVVASLARGADPLRTAPIRDAASAVDSIDLYMEQGISCASDGDCNDYNACTEDSCVEEACTNATLPGCVPCQAGIRQALANLAEQGLAVDAHLLGITDTGERGFSCLTDSLLNLLDGTVPGELDTCVFPEGPSPSESWGPATAIVAERWSWLEGARRVIVPIGDEGPCNGTRLEGCNDPGDDRDTIENAIAVAVFHDVTVSPIMGTGSDECTLTLASRLADGTGGTMLRTVDATSGLSDAIVQMLLDACGTDEPCPPLEIVFVMDTSGSMRDEADALCGDDQCDDGNACTDQDTCVDGVCLGVPNFDETVFCCSPETGSLIRLDDEFPCTEDLCDPQTGRVQHIPFEDGTPRDDGLFCTVGTVCSFSFCEGGSTRDCSSLNEACVVGVCNEQTDQCELGGQAPEGTTCDDGDVCTSPDTCDFDGLCVGTDLNKTPCTSSDDCFGVSCDPGTGFCRCNETPLLCLKAVAGALPAGDCFLPDEVVTVLVELGFSTTIVIGGDLHIDYDPAVFDFVDVVPGQTVDPESPFALPLFLMVDEIAGRVTYSIGTPPGEPGTTGPAIMAAVRFVVRSACTSDELCFLNENPFTTKLTGIGGELVPFVECCTGELIIHGAAPIVSCPPSVKVNADPGTARATVTWTPPVAEGECDGELAVSCTAEHSFGVNIDHLIQTGGLFPVGLSQFECTTTDSCGGVGTCAWNVEISQFNLVEVDLELSPRMSEDSASQPLSRCIEFEFFSNCVQRPEVVRETVSFGLPFDLTGHATGVTFKVPAGAYVCVTARDPQHTLRSFASPEIVGDRYRLTFAGDPFFGGNWLVNGNLDGNNIVDILDFGIFLEHYLTARNPNTTCDTTEVNADFNADGVVDQLDLSFISLNFLASDKNSCCPSATSAAALQPRIEVSLAELRTLGLGRLGRLDVDGDGWLTLSDIAAVLQTGLPAPAKRLRLPSERSRLSR